MKLAQKARRTVRGLFNPVRVRSVQEGEYAYLNSIRCEKKFVFVTGMHRSGTTFLAKYLSGLAGVSGFDHIPGDMDEGQFVQSVFPVDSDFGGMAYFGYHPQSRMIEKSERENRDIGVSLLKDWLVYLDRRSEIFLEKTPSNFRRSRLLSAAFPNSTFIHVVRHPAVTALALKSFSPEAFGVKDRSARALIGHWLHCQKQALSDFRWLKSMGKTVIVVALEDFPVHADSIIKTLNADLDLQIDVDDFRSVLDPNPNAKYYAEYREVLESGLFNGEDIDRALSIFGYSRDDITKAPDYLDWITGG